MTATVIEIADAVVAALNVATIQFACHCSAVLSARVRPEGHGHAPCLRRAGGTRRRDRRSQPGPGRVQDPRRCAKRVAHQRSAWFDQAAIDGLMQLVQDIDDLFRHKPLAGFPQAIGRRPKTSPFTTPST